jgi:hypothetical protein
MTVVSGRGGGGEMETGGERGANGGRTGDERGAKRRRRGDEEETGGDGEKEGKNSGNGDACLPALDPWFSGGPRHEKVLISTWVDPPHVSVLSPAQGTLQALISASLVAHGASWLSHMQMVPFFSPASVKPRLLQVDAQYSAVILHRGCTQLS